MTHVLFLFVGEGSSDAGLVPHLEELCVLCGADEAAGVAPDLSLFFESPDRTVLGKLRAALALEPNADLVFVHRDADSVDPEPRYREIMRAASEISASSRAVPVVPVQETEAWLLLDETEIRQVADNPRGKVDLELPPRNRIEATADPKERLYRALELASEYKGRRLTRFKKTLPKRRRRLLERLSPTGPVSQLPAWQRLRRELEQVIADL